MQLLHTWATEDQRTDHPRPSSCPRHHRSSSSLTNYINTNQSRLLNQLIYQTHRYLDAFIESPFTVIHSDWKLSALIVHQREMWWKIMNPQKWICFSKCSFGLQNLQNKCKHVFVCFRVLNLLLWDYLCMKSCLVNPSAFEVLVIKKNQWKLSDFLFNVFTQSYFICKWRGPLRWGGNGIMRATAVIPDPSRNTLTPQSHL